MPLINSPRHSNEDISAWQRFAEHAGVHAQLRIHHKHVQRARDALLSFAGAGSCYAAVSWGKDSVVVAHLTVTLAPQIPLVWVRVAEDYNPDCPLVRDAFLRMHPGALYDEIEWNIGRVNGPGYLSEAAGPAHGERYVSGVRADESASRRRRVARWGEATARTCAPLARWSGNDVFGYLIANGLPIHPAYACTMGGLLDPTRIRVSALGGEPGSRCGDGMGRHEWERRYYGRELAALNT
jgi:phosphoadenosine phosphosulfate reductase